jgi:nitrile hydratase subunit alpha
MNVKVTRVSRVHDMGGQTGFGPVPAGEDGISVWDSTSEARYMVLPARPAGTGALDTGQLAALVTRNGLIGTALV